MRVKKEFSSKVSFSLSLSKSLSLSFSLSLSVCVCVCVCVCLSLIGWDASCKAKPFWVQFQDASGAITDAVMKAGDDLRQDQVVLGMLEMFNAIWQREGVVHILAGTGATVPVFAPL